MKTFRRQSVTVNTGSMADIAFLLLIFFLVMTTISADKGVLRKLPPVCPPNTKCDTKIHERNILRIAMNAKQEIFLEDKIVELSELKTAIKNFVDNNGKNICDYCYGNSLKESSDHPTEAVISISYDDLTKYELFISVQDEITKAYYELRSRYAKKKFNKVPENLNDVELKEVKNAYPFVVSEVLIKRNN